MACRRRLTLGGIIGFVVLALVPDAAHFACGAPAARFPVDLVASIPPRGASAPTGSQLMGRLAVANREERARVLVEQILEGNIPSALRQLRAVETCAPVVSRSRTGLFSRASRATRPGVIRLTKTPGLPTAGYHLGLTTPSGTQSTNRATPWRERQGIPP